MLPRLAHNRQMESTDWFLLNRLPNTVNHASVRGVGGPLAIEYSQQIRSTAIGRFILAACIGLLAIGT